jgi:CRP/FNR family cyclic AMP-dependent transcriptional regulator
MDVYGRVASLLLDMSKTIDGQQVIDQKVSRQDIGRMIGASREMVSRVMKDLETRGILEVKGNSILIHEKIAAID